MIIAKSNVYLQQNLVNADYFKKRKALDHEIDKTLAEIQCILGINVNVDELKNVGRCSTNLKDLHGE